MTVLSEDIKQMDYQVKQLEKNRDYLKGEILNQSSFELVNKYALQELGLKDAAEGEIVTYCDSLLSMIKSSPKPSRKYQKTSTTKLAQINKNKSPHEGGLSDEN